MEYVIKLNGKKFKSLRINFSKENRMKDILATLIKLELPLGKIDRNNWEFVVLELLTNSIRASIEKKTDEKIYMHLKIEEHYMWTSIIDGAGGFDLEKLPYDIHKKANEIDVFGTNFEDYRLQNNYLRYGLGLYSAKKFGDEFNLFFTDINGNKTISYKKNELIGTSIIVKKNLNKSK